MSICSIEGCDVKVKARGWCKLHYQHWQRKNKGKSTAKKIIISPCSVHECTKSAIEKYLCPAHLKRLKFIKQISLLLN